MGGGRAVGDRPVGILGLGGGVTDLGDPGCFLLNLASLVLTPQIALQICLRPPMPFKKPFSWWQHNPGTVTALPWLGIETPQFGNLYLIAILRFL